MTPCKHILITGAGSGVGECLALRLAESGMKVSALARSADKLNALAARNPGISAYPADVTDSEALSSVVRRILDTQGPIDALVNNAAVFERKPFWEQSLETIDRIIDTNLKGTLYMTHAVLPHMIERKAGKIINISSVAGTRGIPAQAAYCASKHGMTGFGDALAQELIPHGISLCTLCPGGIRTPLWNPGTNPYPGDTDRLLTPEEVCELVEFILSRPPGNLYKRVVFFPSNEWH
jgi:NADP-dependent 3-hydroxy acid dehydrogenase YdfG